MKINLISLVTITCITIAIVKEVITFISIKLFNTSYTLLKLTFLITHYIKTFNMKKVTNTSKTIINLLINNKESLTGTELLNIATECKKIFHSKLKKEKNSNLTCGDITRCSTVFTDYYIAENS